ncbi:MAG: hypothetical protein NVSMB25_21990 [Thermoleophilaceae bacterium]
MQARAETEHAQDLVIHAEMELAQARDELTVARVRVTELEQAQGAADGAREGFAEADAELAAQRSEAEQQAARAGEADRALVEIRGRLAKSEETVMALAISEQALRQERDLLTRTDLGDQENRRSLRRAKVSSRQFRETLAELEQERTARAALEAERVELAAEVRQLEEKIAGHESTPSQASVEADLRHLLATRQRELDEARVALRTQHARYASVASQVPALAAGDPPSVPAESKPWTAVDEDLLARITRAKEFAGQD